MVFLGGHTANFPFVSAYFMHIAMIVSSAHEDLYNKFKDRNEDFTSWGLRFMFLSGGAGAGFGGINPGRTIGHVNISNYFQREDRRFWNHLYSDAGMIQQLFAGRNYFMDNHSRTFPYSGRWTNSTSFTIGLVNAMGLNHRLTPAQIANSWGINNAFDARYFGR